MHARRVLTAGAAALATCAVVATTAWGATGPELISVSSSGAELAPEVYDSRVDDDADRVVFVEPSKSQGEASHVYVRDRSSGKTTKIYTSKVGDGAVADISGSGTYVVIGSGGTLRVRNINTGSTQWLRGVAGASEPSISSNGRWVAFRGSLEEGGPVHAYRWNLATDAITKVSHKAGVRTAKISGDGRHVAYTVDGHAYQATASTGQWELLDQSPTGEPGNFSDVVLGGVSYDGHYVTFTSGATNLVDGSEECEQIEGGCVFRRDTAAGSTEVASIIDGKPSNALYISAISDDGNVVVFSDVQAFARDMSSGETVRVSENSLGAGADSGVDDIAVDADGSDVVFTSRAGNLGADGHKERIWLTSTGF